MQSIILVSSSLLISFILSKIFQNYFIRNNFIDKINKRSSHSVLATRSGGSTIVTTLLIISVVSYILNIQLFEYSLLVPLLLLFVVGLYDDIYDVDFKLKFIFQIIAAKLIIDNGLIIDNFHGLFGIFELNRVIAQLFTIFIIVAIVNSINFIDGIDGLAISVIILFILLFEFFSDEITPFKNLSIILLASLLPMYYFNFKNKNKVFLGDSGSLFLGGVVSVYAIFILTNNYIIKPEFDMHKIAFVVSILFYPIIDIIRVFIIRVSNNKSPFIADKNHIHHIFLKKINNHILIVALIISISILFIIIAQVINKI